jgi:hypothetical protein
MHVMDDDERELLIEKALRQSDARAFAKELTDTLDKEMDMPAAAIVVEVVCLRNDFFVELIATASPKANIRRELRELAEPIEKLLKKLAELSPETHEYLAEGGIDFAQLARLNWLCTNEPRDFTKAVPGELVPPLVYDGRPSHDAQRRLLLSLDELWAAAWGGEPPKNGRPKFIEACIEGLHEFGMPTEEDALNKLRRPKPR